MIDVVVVVVVDDDVLSDDVSVVRIQQFTVSRLHTPTALYPRTDHSEYVVSPSQSVGDWIISKGSV